MLFICLYFSTVASKSIRHSFKVINNATTCISVPTILYCRYLYWALTNVFWLTDMLLTVLLASLAFSESTPFHDLSHEELVNRSISLRGHFASTASANDLYGLSFAEAVSAIVIFTGELLQPYCKDACCLPKIEFQMTAWGSLESTQHLLLARLSSVDTGCSASKFQFFYSKQYRCPSAFWQ